jgi:HSP20 family molecular chaperone IbpA
MDTNASKVTVPGNSKSQLAIGAAAILAIGVLLGHAVTRYTAGIPVAAAATKSAKNLPPTAAVPGHPSAALVEWNPFQELRNMQLQMDQMVNSMTTEFRTEPRLSFFADTPGYSLSLRVRDLKDHYEVHAFLPDAKSSDVNVSLLDKQTLKVEVSNKSTETSKQKGANGSVTKWGQYAQIISLPAPVKSEQMKIDRPNHELLITLPKA